MNLLALLVALTILCLIFWCVNALTAAFEVPAPVAVVAKVLLVIFAVLWLLKAAGLPTP